MEYDFSGWATRNNIQCSDGRTIMKDAFKQNDGQKVPLVWNHQHDDPNEVLGHALLENRDEGVYAYCKFNDTESGQTAKSLVLNGDVDKLSIYANKLKSEMNNVVHGCIREVSLVLAGANPGAFIDSVIVHNDESSEEEEEGTIYTDEIIKIASEEDKKETDNAKEGGENVNEEVKEDKKVDDVNTNVNDEKKESENTDANNEELNHSDDKTIKEIFESFNEDQKKATNLLIGLASGDEKLENDEEKAFIKTAVSSMSEEQKDAMYSIIGAVLEGDKEKNEKEGEDNMKHNVFENDAKEEKDVIMHSEIIADAIADAKKYGSMKESFIAHAEEAGLEWGTDNDFSVLFPDAKNLDKEPRLIEKDNSWVGKVMAEVKHSPFSRVKNTLGRMNEETARAKGYVKGTKKVNIAMALLNRVTTPTTVYIKNDIDRDDVIDITDFDIVAWQKREMRKLLNKELALAMLLGDGRDVSDPYKINEQNIRPILTDDDIYTIKYTVTDGVDYNDPNNSHSENDSVTKGVIRAAIKARKNYKGSGRPTFFTTEDTLTDMLLVEDQNGRIIYDSVEKLATALRVKEIVTIPEMENYEGIYGIIVNLNDYTAGADKGGNVNLFDDFDIDYNQMKYLIETRMSGALTVPYSAIVLKKEAGNSNEEPQG